MTLTRTVSKAIATAVATLACIAAMFAMAAPANAALTDTQAPTVPTQPNIGFDAVCTHAWWASTASTDNVDEASEIRYELYVDGEYVRTSYIREVWLSERPGTHTYAIRAVDTAGNASALSQPVTYTF